MKRQKAVALGWEDPVVVGALFSFRGRLARLPYFGYGLATAVMMLVLIGMGAGVMEAAKNVPVVRAITGLLFVGGAIVCAIWIGIGLTVRRLHDMGLVGTHAIWIYLLSILAELGLATHSLMGAVLVLPNFGASLWLLFKPGMREVNRFGSPPGAEVGTSVLASGAVATK
jgi:uncharacterized membrane protein YhaH (DUF805 family)